MLGIRIGVKIPIYAAQAIAKEGAKLLQHLGNDWRGGMLGQYNPGVSFDNPVWWRGELPNGFQRQKRRQKGIFSQCLNEWSTLDNVPLAGNWWTALSTETEGKGSPWFHEPEEEQSGESITYLGLKEAFQDREGQSLIITVTETLGCWGAEPIL